MDNPPRKRKKATSTSSDLQPAVNPQNFSAQDNQDVVTIDVPAVEVPELTADEQRDRLHLERKVERAFFEAGKALMELRDRRLYRSTHRTFEDYCRDRFGHSRQQSNYLIAAAQVYENLTTNGTQILPTSDIMSVEITVIATVGKQSQKIPKPLRLLRSTSLHSQ